MSQFKDRMFTQPLSWEAWTKKFARPNLSEGEASQLLYLGTTINQREYPDASPSRPYTEAVLSDRIKFYIDAAKSQNSSFAWTARDLTVKYWLRQVERDYSYEFDPTLQLAFEFLSLYKANLSRPPYPAIVEQFVQNRFPKMFCRYRDKPVPDSLFESAVRCVLKWGIPDLLTRVDCPSGAHAIVQQVLREWDDSQWTGTELTFKGTPISQVAISEETKVIYRRAQDALLYLTARNYLVVNGEFVKKVVG